MLTLSPQQPTPILPSMSGSLTAVRAAFAVLPALTGECWELGTGLSTLLPVL